MNHSALTRLSLDGLSVGDAFGELLFGPLGRTLFRHPHPNPAVADLPPGPWLWTDDTHMAISIVEVLEDFGYVEQDALARTFVARFRSDPYRGYGAGAMQLLDALAGGADWRRAAPALFGSGSYGNGAAMRAGPIGGWFAGDPARAASEAQRSAAITHAHLEGQAGAMAVAAAAALAAGDSYPTGVDLLTAVLPFVPDGLTREGIERARSVPADDLMSAITILGTGARVSAQDTVPFCLWSAAHHLDDYRAALWHTARGMGDVDTTCAIVGGIVALSSRHVPAEWIERREALPEV